MVVGCGVARVQFILASIKVEKGRIEAKMNDIRLPNTHEKD